MRSFTTLALAVSVAASPFTNVESEINNATIGLAGNPFAGAQMYANSFYAQEVAEAVKQISDPSLAQAAAKAASISSFFWLDEASKVPILADFVKDAKAKSGNYVIPIVVYDLPNRDCAALASNGEYSVKDGGDQKYRAYINAVRQQLVAAGSQKFVIVFEPDSLANLVTNMNERKCQEAASTYRTLSAWALKQLDLPNAAIYLDAGHAGWLGWEANLGPAAQLFGDIYNSAGKPGAVRGLATNVANYNAWKFGSGNSCPSIAETNKVCDEYRYVHKLEGLLRQKGFPAHFIIDTSRNGVQPTRQQKWGNWCNVVGTGFGVRPTSNTGDSLVDAFVWVKISSSFILEISVANFQYPGGECDGTSDQSAQRFDAHCASSDALQPAPQAGSWFQAYFEQLVRNANPPL